MRSSPQLIRFTGSIVIPERGKYLKMTKRFKEIKVVFFGSDQFSAVVLEDLIKTETKTSRLEISTVITTKDSNKISKVASKYNLPILTPEKLDEDFINNHFSLIKCDLFLVVSYGKILPKEILNIPKLGALNIHPSLLPKYRGASPIQNAILNGDKETGVTIIKMDEQMDHGPIIAQERLDISDKDNYLTLGNKLFLAGLKLLLEIIPQIIGAKARFREQNHNNATFTKMVRKEDGYFEIENPPDAGKLDRMIRAYYPWPGTWAKWNGKIVKFLPEGLVQMEGKKAVPLKDFLNGYPKFPLKTENFV